MHYNNDTYGYAPVVGDNIKYHINRYNITQLSKYNFMLIFLFFSSYNLDNIYQNVSAQNILKNALMLLAQMKIICFLLKMLML